MTSTQPTAFEYLQNSQAAHKQGDLVQARHWARLAVSLEPNNEEAWLWMGAIASPQASVGYLQRALEINPASERARQGLAWAQKRINAGQMAETRPHKVQRAAAFATSAPRSVRPESPAALPKKTRPFSRLNLTTAFIALTVLCLAVGLAAALNTSDARAFLRRQGVRADLAFASPTPLPTDTNVAGSVSAALDTATPLAVIASATAADTALPLPTLTSVPSQQPSATPAVTAAASPTILPTDTAAPTARPTKVPAVQPASAPSAAKPAAPAAPASNGGGQRIVISISKQHMWVYEGDTLVYSFVVSTGLHNSTATGSFTILDKIPNAYGSTWDLWMPDWMGIYYSGNLENGIHALPILSNGQTLWAGLLGQPASFGCIILSTADAKTLYNWAEVGTPVIIQG